MVTEHHRIDTPPEEALTPKRRRALNADDIVLDESVPAQDSSGSWSQVGIEKTRSRPPTPPMPSPRSARAVKKDLNKRPVTPSPRSPRAAAAADVPMEAAPSEALVNPWTDMVSDPAQVPQAAGTPAVYGGAPPPTGTATSEGHSNSTFSFVPAEPLIQAVDTRVLELEVALHAAQRHAQAVQEKQLEQEELLRNVIQSTADAKAKSDHRDSMRAMELAELERRLASEQNAKYRVNQQLDSSAATTAELTFRLNELSAAMAAQMQLTQDAADRSAAAAAAAAEQTVDITPAQDAENEAMMFRSAFQQQNITMMSQGSQIDRLTQALETTQRTLLQLVHQQTWQGPASVGEVLVPPALPCWVPTPVPPKALRSTGSHRRWRQRRERSYSWSTSRRGRAQLV